MSFTGNPRRRVCAPIGVRTARTEPARKESSLGDRAIARLYQLMRHIQSTGMSARDRDDLLGAVCRFAAGTAGYAGAVITLIDAKTGILKPAAWQSVNSRRMDGYIERIPQEEPRTIAGWVLTKGSEFICNDPRSLPPQFVSGTDIVQAGYRSIIALPLRVDSSPVGVLTLASNHGVTPKEARLLEDVATSLSSALQLVSRTEALKTVICFDPLTGLARRSLFCARLAVRERIAPESVAVLDVAQLTALNHAIGRTRTDLVIREVADMLKRHFGGADTVGCLGGGTFALALPLSLDAADAADRLRERIGRLFSEPCRIDGRDVLIRVRCGIAHPPDGGRNPEELLQSAEAALRSAKRADEICLTRDPQSVAQMIRQVELEPRLRRAIDRQEFQVHYQPLVSLASGRIAAMEALLRWNDPEYGIVLPGAFIPMLESANLMVAVGEWVLQRVACDLQAWQQAGFGPLRVAVNMSPQQLRRPDFVARMLELAARFQTSEYGVDIEITEAMLHHDCQPLAAGLQQLRQAGMRVAIDDFGTGYSSLSRLASLPVDALKIDRSFVTRLPHDQTTAAIVATITGLAKALGLCTIAEGVESAGQLQCLASLGCDWVQGFLHGAAAPASHIYAMLHAQSLSRRDAQPFTVLKGDNLAS